MKKWICTVCNYIHEGEEPPDICPVCGAERDKFMLLEKQTTHISDNDQIKSLEEVRDRARQNMTGICAVYPACDGQPDRICQRQAYGGPIKLGGAGSGASFTANISALARLKLRTQLVGDHFDPDPSKKFLDKLLSVPIMGSSTAGPGKYNKKISERDFCEATIQGCRDAGTITWRGDTFFYSLEDHPGLDTLETEEGYGIPIFKPRSQDILKKLIERAEKIGCPAVGVDLDGCGSTIMALHGQPVFRKNKNDLRTLVKSTSLPFIAKGIMTPEDAEACVEAGISIIAVSNHGGRVLDSTPGVADVLPAIVERIKGKAFITADGGVRTGYDVLKMIALGADAVLIGRDIIRAAMGGGALGVKMHMEHLRKVLKQAMIMTGCPTISAIDSRVLIS